MQLEKEKKEKRERERCRALAQRIAEEANPASAALLGEQMLLLAKALHRAGVEAEEWTESSEAELLVVADPAWETLPETLPARVLLVSDESTVMAGWAEQLAQRGYFRDFGWRSKGRAQPSALFCTSQPTQLKMVRGYEMEMDILRDRMVRAERTCNEEAALIERLRSDLSLSRSHAKNLEKTLNEVGDKVPESEKEPIRAGVEKLKETLKGEDTDAIKAATEELTQLFYKMSEKLYQQQAPQGDPNMGGQQPGGDPNGGQQYYDADYKVVDDDDQNK